jgi:hypothetical protein
MSTHDRIEMLVQSLDYSEEERRQLVRLMSKFVELPKPPDPNGDFADYGDFKQRFLECIDGENPDALEESFLHLYEHLHMMEARYTKEEREQMDLAGGYWAHAGGLSPILKAGAWISPATVAADLGAGNGLQGLLIQLLYPHQLTIQYEISSNMVKIGQGLQEWLGIAEERIEWIVGDVCDQVFEDIDFYYLYRPVRPDTERGEAFYENLAEMLDWGERPVVIFSIADCLKKFLSRRFKEFYNDGHLTCFRSDETHAASLLD